MKKIISTSIGSLAFNLEEDAHDKISAYLAAISKSLSASDGHDEIMADIEARIAEILQQKIKDSQQVVTIAEIDEVISIMGTPEDFSPGTGQQKQQSYSSSKEYGAWGRRRIYRDADEKVILGVCSGLSHHFGIDPIWLRLAFGLSIFLGGFGIILYFLLAAIMPKARTTAEKLEMRGEPVDINNIRKSIEEEMESIKKKVKGFGDEMKSGSMNNHAREFSKDLGDFFSSAGHGAGNLVVGIVKAILMFFAFLLAFIFGMLLIGLIVSFTSGVNVIHIHNNGHWFHYSMQSLFDLLSISGNMRVLLLTGICLFLGIPLLALTVRFGRAALGRKQPFQWFNITASILWTIGLILMLIGVSSVFSHFSVTDFTRSSKVVSTQSAKMLYVKLDDDRVGENVLELDSLNVYISDQNELRGSPSVCVEQSPDSNYHLVLAKTARGVTRQEADMFADDIDYNFSNHDSTLALEPYFGLEMNRGWRKQKLELSLQVPLNKSVSLPDGIDYIACKAMRKKGQHLGGQKWTMTGAGLVPLQN